MRDLARREQRLAGSEMNVASDPLELREVGLIKRAADAERPHGTGRAAAETCPIRRDGSYHCRCPFKRWIDALSPGQGTMPALQLEPDQIGDLLAYLNTLE
jgi:hypothetical protein